MTSQDPGPCCACGRQNEKRRRWQWQEEGEENPESRLTVAGDQELLVGRQVVLAVLSGSAGPAQCRAVWETDGTRNQIG